MFAIEAIVWAAVVIISAIGVLVCVGMSIIFVGWCLIDMVVSLVKSLFGSFLDK